MSEDKLKMRHAYFPSNLKIREEQSSDDKYIEGYFIVYNQITEICEGVFERIAVGAAEEAIKNNDIRCLFNHNRDIVLGRTSAGTLELKSDSYGVWGRVKINPEDRTACDVYARVARGDITNCSFGFYATKESYELQKDDSMLWTEEIVDVHEVTICTFPAYAQTEIEARAKQREVTKKRATAAKREALKKRLEEIKC